jgi:hypothetical protein
MLPCLQYKLDYRISKKKLLVFDEGNAVKIQPVFPLTFVLFAPAYHVVVADVT